MPIGIVIALPTEWRYFRNAFHVHYEHRLHGRKYYTGRFGRLPIAVVLSGVGKENAREATRIFCDTYKLSVLLSIGYAGGLNPELKRGDIVLSAFAGNQKSTGPQPGDLTLENHLRSVADESHEHHVYISPIYTADKIVARHEEKKQLFKQTKLQIVDLESFAVYSEAKSRGIPFVGIHTITDTAEEDIPALEIINPFLTSNSMWRYPRIFWDIAIHPRLIVDFIILNHDAQVAGRSLTHFLISNRANLGNLLAHL